MVQDVKGSTATIRFRNGKTGEVPVSLLKILELPTPDDKKNCDEQIENADKINKK